MYKEAGVLYRQVNDAYREDFFLAKSSGLYEELQKMGLLIPAEEVASPDGAVATLKPKLVPFISYPYEWCFGQLKDAALLTLEIQAKALAKGMSLKDASAYNVQFLEGKPILIDSLSFERYKEGAPWVAYRQFCRHFLAPLALMALVDVRLGLLLRDNIDGIPLDLASSLLPGSTRFKPGLMMHVHMHGKAEASGGSGKAGGKTQSIGKTAMLALIDNLRSTVESLKWDPKGTIWGDYYSDTNYTEASAKAKHDLVSQAVAKVPVDGACWDLGANTGEYSRLAAEKGFETIAWDVDPAAVEKGYRFLRDSKTPRLLPLLQDLTNPSPMLGWASAERDGLLERGPAQVVMALALIHHMAIANNVPLQMFAEFLAKVGRYAVVEFVPKADSQVQRLLSSREDVFPGYTEAGWEAALAGCFELVEKWLIPGTSRTLYLLRRLGA